ncbi:GGDEF domain-containing protein [Parafrankia sp. EUN1f]|uniref:GGDEF domain-containing protein n=1 Tax=Parafrankia sp. EUN1f TaxID=102897 RepID=UPI0001C46376|nr:GGDEF domain-containing protein [Parafrankia sp. EUN1f]EFC81454.1 diguanylate cyclase [Parafrankia sp. EUN1f]
MSTPAQPAGTWTITHGGPTAPAGPVSRRAFRRLAAVSAGATLLVLALSLALPESSAELTVRTATLAAGNLALACCIITARRSPPAERAWRLLLSAALLSIIVTKAVVFVTHAVDGNVFVPDAPIGTAGDLVIYPLTLAGLLTFPTQTPPHRDGTLGAPERDRSWYGITLLDCLLVAGSLVLLGAATIIVPQLEHRLGPGDLAVTLAGTAGKLVLLVAIMLLTVFRRPRGTGSLALVGASMMIFILVDSAHLHSVAGGREDVHPAVDVGFIVGRLLLALAVAAPASGRLAAWSRRGPPALWVPVTLPYLPVAGVGALVAVQAATDSLSLPVIYGAVALLFLALIRQMIILADNTRLLTRLQESRAQLHHLAFHDPLTGLANRALFADRLERAVACHKRDRTPLTLLFCDLDDFKDVNDTLGHASGDELLRATARRLADSVRAADSVARLGGDEFAVLLAGADDPRATGDRVAAAIRQPCSLAATVRAVKAWSGGPGGSHPRAPTERSVNLSVHSALLTVIRSAWMPRPSARTVWALDRGARSTMP